MAVRPKGILKITFETWRGDAATRELEVAVYQNENYYTVMRDNAERISREGFYLREGNLNAIIPAARIISIAWEDEKTT